MKATKQEIADFWASFHEDTWEDWCIEDAENDDLAYSDDLEDGQSYNMVDAGRIAWQSPQHPESGKAYIKRVGVPDTLVSTDDGVNINYLFVRWKKECDSVTVAFRVKREHADALMAAALAVLTTKKV